MQEMEATAKMYAAPTIIPAGRGGKATALVSVRGTALYETEFQPIAFSTLLLQQTIRQLAQDPEVGTIVLEIDSPGGVVTGTQEAADAIFEARQTKRVVALVNPLAASAAYWIASQAHEIIAVPSADVGSVGVFMMHADCSGMMEASGIAPTFIFAGQYKTEGNPFEPLTAEARDFLQGEVDGIYRQFIRAVARGRDVPTSKVEADFGQGRTFTADVARKAGMIDRVATINTAFARWGVNASMLEGRRGRRIDAADQPEPLADAFGLTEEDLGLSAPEEGAEPEASNDAPEGEDAATVETVADPAPEDTPAEDGADDERKARVAARRRRLALLRA